MQSYNLENKHQNIGLGMILENLKSMRMILLFVKKNASDGIRHSALLGKPIKKVAFWVDQEVMP
jgi:hypothetical protein